MQLDIISITTYKRLFFPECVHDISLLYDVHVHLTDSRFLSYLNEIISSLRAMRIVACSVTIDIETTLRSFELLSPHRDVIKQFVGIHPEASAREDWTSLKKSSRRT